MPSSTSIDSSEELRYRKSIAGSFTPSAPVSNQDVFAGRLKQLQQLISVASQSGQHAVIYGDRGVGKTSLANVVSEILSRSQIVQQVVRYNCTAKIDFNTIWRQIFREISIPQPLKAPIGFRSEFQLRTAQSHSLAAYLPENAKPEDLRYLLQQVPYRLAIVIDELDRIGDQKVTSLLADTIKTLSDHAVECTLILVGVADSVDQLISEHRSIERALAQIHMQRMLSNELEQVVQKGVEKSEMSISRQAKSRIAKLSQGLPHYTHLLAYNSASCAVDSLTTHITIEHVRHAVKQAVESSQQSVISEYHRATRSPRENLYQQVLLACALARTDDLDFFSAGDVREPMSHVMNKPYEIPAFSRHLNDFCEDHHGPVLKKIGVSRRYKFRFINPLLEPYIIMRGLDGSLISEDYVEALE